MLIDYIKEKNMINKDITIDIEGNEAKLTLYILDSSPELYY